MLCVPGGSRQGAGQKDRGDCGVIRAGHVRPYLKVVSEKEYLSDMAGVLSVMSESQKPVSGKNIQIQII